MKRLGIHSVRRRGQHYSQLAQHQERRFTRLSPCHFSLFCSLFRRSSSSRAASPWPRSRYVAKRTHTESLNVSSARDAYSCSVPRYPLQLPIRVFLRKRPRRAGGNVSEAPSDTLALLFAARGVW
jgi:hypothetical protein